MIHNDSLICLLKYLLPSFNTVAVLNNYTSPAGNTHAVLIYYITVICKEQTKSTAPKLRLLSYNVRIRRDKFFRCHFFHTIFLTTLYTYLYVVCTFAH